VSFSWSQHTTSESNMTLQTASRTHSALFSSPAGLLPRLYSTLSSRNGSFAVPQSGNLDNSFIVLSDRASYQRYSADFDPCDLYAPAAEATSPSSSNQLVRVGSQALPLSTASYARSFTSPKPAAAADAYQQCHQQQQQQQQQQDVPALDFDTAAAQPDWDVVPSWSFHHSTQHSSSSGPGMQLARQLYADHQLQQLEELRRVFSSQQQQQSAQHQQRLKSKKIGKLLTHKLSSM
jgi:hypothetical protein